ncbi:MAG: DNA-directed RNA polymerase subunit E'' [Nanoarchaeota archaeon]|nr:DNA-directed RNA polymerase subunit E'' [Nanoarchaeota archaeon]
MKRKVCRRCKIFVDEDLCPICKKDSFSTNWQGRIFIANHEKSFIAKEMDIHMNGEYTIKVR